MLWAFLTDEARVLRRVDLRSQRDNHLADVWQIDLEKLAVEPSQVKERCTTCQRIATRHAPEPACTRHNCHGTTVTEQPDEENYDVWLMGRPFEMVTAEEHTAQVPGEVRNKIEQDFKSRHGRTNCLVATPTLEMGVNIGALDMALMRNVPPRASNYWQRAGRAGREERMAVVVTYCRRSNHDRYFFDDPLRLLGGSIEAPAFNLRNPLMVAKHVRSAILSELLLRSTEPERQGTGQGCARSILFPTFIRSYLLDEENHFRETPTSIEPLRALLSTVKDDAGGSAGHPVRPALARGSRRTGRQDRHRADHRRDGGSTGHGDQAAPPPPDVGEGDPLRPAPQEGHRAHRAGGGTTPAAVRRVHQSIVTRDRQTYTLTVLAIEGFLPGYGVYEGGIIASARRGFARQSGPRAFDLSRSNVVALREFIPGNRLYANRGSFYVSRYHLGADETARIRTLRVDPLKGYVTDQPVSRPTGRPVACPSTPCP